MLNKDGIRELAYVVRIDDIKPIEGRDRVECAIVGGWTVMVRKEQFAPGDYAIYFEIDSKVPEVEPFKFLEAKHYKIKTQGYKTPSGKFWSQGLVMGAEDFGWETTFEGIIDDADTLHRLNDESRFLTKKLGVTYSLEGDNKRKGKSGDKYKAMAARHPKLFQIPIIKKLYKTKFGKKILFFFLGKRRDKRSEWPYWVKKTDEERIQNCPWILKDPEPWYATEKIDGTSATFTLMKKKFGKWDYRVCSRNVVFDVPDKKCFYDSNVYLEASENYDMEHVLHMLFEWRDLWVRKNGHELQFVTIQGEIYGDGIQKRNYSLKNGEHKLAVFNLIFGYEDGTVVRANPFEMIRVLQFVGIPYVPIDSRKYVLPKTVPEILEMVTGASIIDGEMREGLVFRSEDGVKSFKAVSNEYLEKYHE